MIFVFSHGLQDVNNVVKIGLLVINKCIATPALIPDIKTQTAHWITVYADPTGTDIERVIQVLVILDKMQATGSIKGRQWPDSFYSNLEDMLSRVKYNEDVQQYGAYYDPQETGSRTAAGNIIRCLRVISQTLDNQCKVLGLIQRQQHNITLMEKDTEVGKQLVRDLLNTLQSHSCTKRDCVGGRRAARLLATVRGK